MRYIPAKYCIEKKQEKNIKTGFKLHRDTNKNIAWVCCLVFLNQIWVLVLLCFFFPLLLFLIWYLTVFPR